MHPGLRFLVLGFVPLWVILALALYGRRHGGRLAFMGRDRTGQPLSPLRFFLTFGLSMGAVSAGATVLWGLSALVQVATIAAFAPLTLAYLRNLRDELHRGQ